MLLRETSYQGRMKRDLTMHTGGRGCQSRLCQWTHGRTSRRAHPTPFLLPNTEHGWPRPDKMAAFSASPVNSPSPSSPPPSLARRSLALSSTSYLRRLFAPAQFRQIETAPRRRMPLTCVPALGVGEGSLPTQPGRGMQTWLCENSNGNRSRI